jgi:GR25 family glycosyltransferase involved in LPS biosynthesis
MKFLHKVFHLEKDTQREHLFNAMNSYISQYSQELNTPTINISNYTDLEVFCDQYPFVKFDKGGYEFNSETGWRYGELGIWASNISAYINFLKSDEDYLILMEDDIEYLPGFFENLVRYISQIEDDWDLFFYYAPANTNAGEFYPEEKDVCRSYQDWSCLCYVINKKAAKKVIDDIHANPISLPIDYYYFRQPDKYISYTVKPTSKLYCKISGLESTFQTKQKRQVLL